jgi:tetratricopeptide (TPR) repeat protein
MPNIEQAYEIAKGGNYDQALEICNDYIAEHPRERLGYKERSYIFERMKNWEAAIEDTTTLIRLGPEEPGDYFTRGRWKVMLDEYHSAIQDFTKAIAVDKAFNLIYYTDACLFFRAFCQLQIGEFEKAIADCSSLEDGFLLWIKGLVTKEDIVSEAKRKLGSIPKA